MAVHGGASKRRRWSDLPGDLLSDIYLRSASAYDRARFAAVCTSWRATAAWHQRLPALPLLLPSTGHGERDMEARAYSPEDGRILRVPLPWFPWGNRLVGSYDGGWIATVSSTYGLLIVNLFSGARAARLTTNTISIQKIVFSKDPSSGGCVMVAMTARGIGLRRLGCPDHRWYCRDTVYGNLVDIAFCNGELLGVTSSGELILFHMAVDKEGAVVGISVLYVDVVTMSAFHTVELSFVPRYIFELRGKLAMAVEVGPREYGCRRGYFFRVFELAKNDGTTTSHRYAWTEVTSLGDHALFLGPAGCSKAVHVSTTAGRRGGVEGNRIYYSKQHTYLHDEVECLERLDIGSCTVHCWGSEAVMHQSERITSRGYHYRRDQDGANGCNACVWLWPPEF